MLDSHHVLSRWVSDLISHRTTMRRLDTELRLSDAKIAGDYRMHTDQPDLRAVVDRAETRLARRFAFYQVVAAAFLFIFAKVRSASSWGEGSGERGRIESAKERNSK